ncbi:hypothetical protein B296_00043254 [Ensete ventricosum]|uniref:Uncharacterized protein n=1 Tax=Ensete ventricosum TaxID=4639 RepID=A0A426XI57_ENSVE|nr:hypothetical protein B296_00043254 [Ensete ventricosum]
MLRWYVKTTALNLLRIGRPKIAIRDHQGIVVVLVLLLPRLKGDFRVTLLLRPLLHLGSSICLSSGGAIATYGRASNYNILDLVLEVVTFLNIMVIIAVKAAISAPIVLLGAKLHWIWWSEEYFLSDLEKDLDPSGVERSI